MINLKELRIGNRVNINGSQYELDAYDFVDYVCDDFDPILLTPEILEKYPFTKIESRRFADIFKIPVAYGMDLLFEEDRMFCSINDDESRETLDHVNYLHQLQNLYFALTGKELVEIKELQEN